MPDMTFNAREAITRLARIESERVAQDALKRIEKIAPSDMVPSFCYVRSELEKNGSGSVVMLSVIARGVCGRNVGMTFVQLRRECESNEEVSILRWGFELFEHMNPKMIANLAKLTMRMTEVEISCREIFKEAVIIDV